MSESLITDQKVTEPQIDESKDYFSELVGEGKKFKDEKALAKGKAYADAMIEFQNKQMDELRADYRKLREEHMAGTSLQELIDQLKSSQQPGSHDSTPNVNTEDKRPVFDTNELKSLVSETYREISTKEKQDKNFNEVRSKLIERYGDNHTAILKKHIDDLGMTVQEADQMARNNPKLFERTFGLDRQPQTDSFDSPPRGGARPTDPFAPNTPKRDYEYYKALRKKDPDLYWSPKTQMQMHEDAQRQGEAFGA